MTIRTESETIARLCGILLMGMNTTVTAHFALASCTGYKAQATTRQTE